MLVMTELIDERSRSGKNVSKTPSASLESSTGSPEWGRETHSVRETRRIADTKTNHRLRGLLTRQRNSYVFAESGVTTDVGQNACLRAS